MKHLWDFLLGNFEKNNAVVLFVVVKAHGSTPGRLGFKMCISQDSTQFGTIGGGIMELKFIKLAHEMLKNKRSSDFRLKEQIHHKYAPKENQSGLICSGEEWLVYGLLEPNHDNIDLSKKIVSETSSNLELQISPKGILVTTKEDNHKNNERYNFYHQSESDWLFRENLSFKNKLYIFGGGHVGLALAQVCSLLDFYVITLDNRTEVETVKSNDFSNKIIIDEYKNAGKYIEEGNSSYIAVVTSSMPTDVEVLSSCLHKNVRYIGLMGSKAKKKEIFTQLQQKGVSEDLFKKIKCPIGIKSVKTHSAQEIAISIAAEIISIKNGE